MRLSANGRLSGRGRAHAPDEDLVAEFVDKHLAVGVDFDVSMLIDLDPDQVLANTASMRMILSRHGRVDYDRWEDRDIGELRSSLEDLLEVIRQENEAAERARASVGG